MAQTTPVSRNRAYLWILTEQAGIVERNVPYLMGIRTLDYSNGRLIMSVDIEPGFIGGLADRYVTAKLSLVSCRVGESGIEAMVAEVKVPSWYSSNGHKRVQNRYFCSAKPSAAEARFFLNRKTVEEHPLISRICAESTIHVPLDGKAKTLDNFVIAVYEKCPHIKPIFYSTNRSLRA